MCSYDLVIVINRMKLIMSYFLYIEMNECLYIVYV